MVITSLSGCIPDIPSTTLQEEALDWLISESDGNDVAAIEDSYRLLERFTLAALFYNTNGFDWDKKDFWLSQFPVCSWQNVGCQNQDGLIDSIWLRKCTSLEPILFVVSIFVC